MGRGHGADAVEAWWRRGGHKGHTSLKFEKDGSLAKCASGAPKSIADKKVRKSVQGGCENRKNAPPALRQRFPL